MAKMTVSELECALGGKTQGYRMVLGLIIGLFYGLILMVFRGHDDDSQQSGSGGAALALHNCAVVHDRFPNRFRHASFIGGAIASLVYNWPRIRCGIELELEARRQPMGRLRTSVWKPLLGEVAAVRPLLAMPIFSR